MRGEREDAASTRPQGVGYGGWIEGNVLEGPGGDPTCWFHATDAAEDFNIFAMCGEGSVGFHFGTRETAGVRLLHMADPALPGRLLRVAIRAENPLRMSDHLTWDIRDVASQLVALGKVTEEVGETVAGSHEVEWLYAALEMAGHDAVVYPNETEGGGDSVFVWRAEQVKSVDAASFDREDPRILPQAPVSAMDTELWLAGRKAIAAAREELEVLTAFPRP